MHEKIEFLQFQLQLSINLQSWFFFVFFSLTNYFTNLTHIHFILLLNIVYYRD